MLAVSAADNFVDLPFFSQGFCLGSRWESVPMTAGLVTIAVVPGERFSMARRSLESVLAHRELSTELIYVDAGSPPLVRQYLEQKASRHRVRLISTERFMAPNEARNLAAASARSKYIAFVDNDVLVSPGWLEALVD
jgi:cellulose synthase/poly-beta-1,6-N-acetylglucosamine synthase-like glycosyltransferase